jgi:hypothetical protein
MTIDPVLLLSEEIRSAEAALREATRQQNRGNGKDHGRLLNLLLARVRRLNAELMETRPTSARGSAELLRATAGRFSFSQSRFITRLHDIADRLEKGHASGADLIWLRAVEVVAREGILGMVGIRVAPLLRSAIVGASRPVMVSETASLSRDNPAWRSVLSMPCAP